MAAAVAAVVGPARWRGRQEWGTEREKEIKRGRESENVSERERVASG